MDNTLKILDDVTVELVSNLQAFVVETCPKFITKELPQEVEAHKHWETWEHLMKNGPAVAPAVDRASASTSAHCPKTLNLQTYKLHALGDYATQIHFFGTTDSYSTQTVKYSDCWLVSLILICLSQGELQHWVGKARYTCTSRKSYIVQLTRIECYQAHICWISMCCSTSAPTQLKEMPNSPDEHHHIGRAQNHPEDLTTFVQRNSDDPATRVCFH